MTAAVLSSKKPEVMLEQNKYVKNMMRILKSNRMNKDAKGLAEVVDYVSTMERDVNKAISELVAIRKELSVMREEQNHPIRTMLSKVANGLMARLRAIQKQIQTIKQNIIGVCKQTVETVKDQGVVAANSIVGEFNIKGEIETQRSYINDAINYCENKISSIDAASKQFHTAENAVRNFGRALMGKEPIPAIKPNGKLAKLLKSPFHSGTEYLKRSLTCTNKALACVDKLEKTAELLAERNRPSIYGDMDRIKGEIARATPKTPTLSKDKAVEELS